MDAMNKVFFDMKNKEHVLITNGSCTLDHSSPEAFRAAHGGRGMGACDMVPHEAIAIRAFPSAEGVTIGWTYRGVDHTQLRQAMNPDAKAMFDKVINTTTRKKALDEKNRYIGRV